MTFDRAIVCLEWVGAVVHQGNADAAHMAGDEEGERKHRALMEEFGAAAEALRAVQEYETVTEKMREEDLLRSAAGASRRQEEKSK